MRALLLDGSGRDGFTSAMCASCSEALEDSGWGAEVVRLCDLDLRHCTGCSACLEGGECVIGDGMRGVMDSFEGCDLLVLACPIRFSGPSSILKAAMDRFQPYWRRGRARGGFSAAMVCGGGPRPDFSPSVRMFRAFSITVGLEWAGCLEVPGTDGMAPADAGPPAREFGLGLAGIAARGPAGGIV